MTDLEGGEVTLCMIATWRSDIQVKDFIRTGSEMGQLSRTTVQKPVRTVNSFSHIWSEVYQHTPLLMCACVYNTITAEP